MKIMKKVLSVVLALSVVMAFSFTCFAATGGTITISNAINGETYNAYKIFDASVSKDDPTKIVYTFDGELDENDFFAQDDQGYITVLDGAKDASGKLNAAAVKFIKENLLPKEAADTETASSQTVVFEGLDYGYYYIIGSSDNEVVATVDTNNENVTVIDKNSTPSIEKKIVDSNGNRVDVDDATLGNVITYEIKVPLLQYDGEKKIDEYFVFDTSDEAITIDSIESVKLEGKNDTVAYDVDDSELGQNFRITIPIQAYNDTDKKYTGTFLYDNNDVAVITVKATLNENAKINTNMQNEVILDWTNDSDKDTPDEPGDDTGHEKGQLPKDDVWSLTSKVLLTKTDGTKSLKGAKFSIAGESLPVKMINGEVFKLDTKGEYYMLKNGSYTKNAPTDTTSKDYDSTEKKYTKIQTVTKDTKTETINGEVYVDNNGQITVTGLGEGTYTITELVAPDGYNKLKDPITLTITFTPNETNTSGSFSAKIDNKNADINDEGVILVDVVNKTGAELPSTGGIGTTIFYVLGAILVLGAAILLITRRRMEAK